MNRSETRAVTGSACWARTSDPLINSQRVKPGMARGSRRQRENETPELGATMTDYDELIAQLIEPGNSGAACKMLVLDAADAIRTLLRERDEMQSQIDALQARVHLCAGYEQALRERDEARAERDKYRGFAECRYMHVHGVFCNKCGWFREHPFWDIDALAGGEK